MENKNFHIIPSVRSIRYLEQALNKKEEWILLSNIHIGNLKDICDKCHKSGKKVIVNHEIVGGLGADKISFHFLKTMYGVDCVMGSSGPKLAMARREGMKTIRRIALVDSLGVDQMLKSLAESKDDIIELRPGYYAVQYLKEFQKVKDCIYIAGGFINTTEMIEMIREAGFYGLTTSDRSLWK